MNVYTSFKNYEYSEGGKDSYEHTTWGIMINSCFYFIVKKDSFFVEYRLLSETKEIISNYVGATSYSHAEILKCIEELCVISDIETLINMILQKICNLEYVADDIKVKNEELYYRKV